MKKLYRLGIILLISWAFIVAFGFMFLSYKEEVLLTLIVKLLYAGIVLFPFYFAFSFIYFKVKKQ